MERVKTAVHVPQNAALARPASATDQIPATVERVKTAVHVPQNVAIAHASVPTRSAYVWVIPLMIVVAIALAAEPYP